MQPGNTSAREASSAEESNSVQGPSMAPPNGPTSAPAAAFDPISEMEDRRNRKEQREKQLSNLKDNRSSKRMNVYLVLGILTILFTFSFFPVTQGDFSENPHQNLSAIEVESWMDTSDANPNPHWSQEQIDDRAENKIWDGSDSNAGSFEQDLNQLMLGLPVLDLGPINDVQVKVSLKGHRFDGGNTSFRLGLFEAPNGCAMLPSALPWESSTGLTDITTESQVIRYDRSDAPALPSGQEVEFALTVKPGRHCLVFQYIEGQRLSSDQWDGTDYQWKATVDAQAQMFWPRALLLPICLLLLPLLVATIIGAQKAGVAYKNVRYPEASNKSTEEQVLDAADAERELGMDLATGAENTDATEESTVMSEDMSSEDESLTDTIVEAEEEANEVIEEQNSVNEAQQSDDNNNSVNTQISQYTDEQLLAAGWSVEQIEQYRGGQS
ncbi:MAG: hypothetical protein VX433_00820 [Candidatus Thermoplasmatota archaeon]|nr:hypothetical protein [Candidatus Thermoplasmatota archaeon]